MTSLCPKSSLFARETVENCATLSEAEHGHPSYVLLFAKKIRLDHSDNRANIG